MRTKADVLTDPKPGDMLSQASACITVTRRDGGLVYWRSATGDGCYPVSMWREWFKDAEVVEVAK